MYQKVIIAGNLGGEVDLRYTPQGTPVCNFSVATNESWTSDGEQQERTTWFRVTCWRRLAEICGQYLSKGRQVLVEGRMNPDPDTGGPRIWTGNDGEPRASYEVTAMTVKFLGGRDSAQEADESEIPF